MNKLFLGSIVLILLVILVVVFIFYKPSSTTSSLSTTQNITNSTGSGNLALLLTDPPILPVGTNNLTLFYKGIVLHGSSGQNYSVNESGSIDLLSLINLTQTLAVLKVPSNVVFDSITFDNASAVIKINNASYNVTINSGSFTTRIKSNITTSSNSAILVDLSPSIIQIYNKSNSTFILHPEAIATELSRNNVSSKVFTPHAINPINPNETNMLKALKSSIQLNLVSLSESNNNLTFSLQVINNGTSNVTIKHVILMGFMSGNINESFNGIGIKSPAQAMPFSMTNSNSSASNTISNIMSNVINRAYNETKNETNNETTIKPIFVQENGSGHGRANINNSGMGLNENRSERFEFGFNHSDINATVMEDMHGNFSNPAIQRIVRGANRFDHNFHDVLNFIVTSNGILSLPFDAQEDEGPNGLTISAGSKATLSFNGKVSLGDGRISISLIPNQTYRIIVIGEDHAFATTSITYKG